MNRYEILILAAPHITEDETSMLERAIEKIVKETAGSTLLSFDKWGKVRLAYPIDNHESGVYFLVRFELTNPKALFDAVHALLTMKYSDSVIRSLSKKMAADEPVVYQRPEIVEDMQTRDVSDFLRKNKMEGLLSSVPGEGEGYRSDRGDRGDRGDRPYRPSFRKPYERRESTAPAADVLPNEEA